MAVLDVRNVTKTYRTGGLLASNRIMAVDDVTLAMSGEKPWILSIVGQSGSGKTTLARMILRLVEPTSGTIWINGTEVRGQLNGSKEAMAFKRMVQPVFQNPFETFSARREVGVYLRETALNLGVAKSAVGARDAVARSLEAVGLDQQSVEGKYIRQFSGGELQRISIARAMVAQPSLIVADEPVASIDASLKMNIVNLFLQLKEEYNTSFVYITHDLSTAYYVSDFIGIMYQGRLVEFGVSKKIMAEPEHPYTKLLLDSVAAVGKKWNGD